jgi:hypothetical protein
MARERQTCYVQTHVQMHIRNNTIKMINSAITLSSSLSHSEEIFLMFIKKKKTPWLQSASEQYRPNDRRLSPKLVPNFADRRCRVVSETDPYGHILGFLIFGGVLSLDCCEGNHSLRKENVKYLKYCSARFFVRNWYMLK